MPKTKDGYTIDDTEAAEDYGKQLYKKQIKKDGNKNEKLTKDISTKVKRL